MKLYSVSISKHFVISLVHVHRYCVYIYIPLDAIDNQHESKSICILQSSTSVESVRRCCLGSRLLGIVLKTRNRYILTLQYLLVLITMLILSR